MTMELSTAMSTLRAVRRLRTDPIPEDVLGRLLQAAAWAPSGGNAQPWRIVVVTDPDKKQALADVYLPAWKDYIGASWAERLAAMPEEQRTAVQKMLKAGDYLAAHMHEAPVLLLFCFNPAVMTFTDSELARHSVTGGGSLFPAVQNLMLACVQEGLGCTLTTLHARREDEVKRILGIPAEWGTSALVPIGYPVGRGHGPITRLPVSEIAYREEFGSPWSPATG